MVVSIGGFCVGRYYCLPSNTSNPSPGYYDCPPGYYCPEGTGVTLLPCPPGTYSDTTNLFNVVQCADCPAVKPNLCLSRSPTSFTCLDLELYSCRVITAVVSHYSRAQDLVPQAITAQVESTRLRQTTHSPTGKTCCNSHLLSGLASRKYL